MGRLMKWISAWLSEFPSTNGRIVATILVMWATATRYLLSGLFGIVTWEPSYYWLGFLGLTMGLDVTQYIGKRATYKEASPVGKDVEDAPAADAVTGA